MQQRWFRAVSAQRHEWLSKRNCALTPAQLAAFFGALGLVSLAIATAWAMSGAWVVVPFACIEIAALCVAFVVYGRHAADFELIVLEPDRVWAQAASGPRLARFECARAAARIEYDARRRGLVRLVGHGQAIELGRFVLEAERAELARELRAALAIQPVAARRQDREERTTGVR